MPATKNINAEKIQGNLSVNSVSAITISATTYYGLPNDGNITGGTYDDGVYVFTNNTGGTFNLSATTTYSAGVISGGTWSDPNNGQINLPQVNVALFNNPNNLEPIFVYTVLSGTTGVGGIPPLTNNDTNYIVIDYNGGTPRFDVLSTDASVNDSNIVLYLIVYRANNFIHVLDFGNQGSGLPNKINDRIIMTERFARESGFSLGLSGITGVVTLSSGVSWNGTYRQSLPSLNSQDDIFFQNYHVGGSWVYTTSSNTLNNLYYDDGTNPVLSSPGKYLVNWYFRGQEVNDHIYEVWGNNEYNSLSEAQLSLEPNLPELITSHAFLVGRIIVEYSATTGSVETSFITYFQGSQVQSHNDLTGIQGGIGGEYFHLDSNQYLNLPLLNTDNIFQSGLTANTISATTYQNLPIDPDTFITGFSYNNNTFTISDNSGNTYSATINDVTGLTINGDFDVTGNTILNGLTANTISATTYQNLPIQTGSFGLVIDGSGSVITTGEKGYLSLPYSGIITGWRIISDQSGSTSVDIWKTDYSTFPPTSGDSITGGNYPNLSSQQINENNTLIGWTTNFSSGDIIAFNVLSSSFVTRINLTINVIKT
jgi:hypothetical protein